MLAAAATTNPVVFLIVGIGGAAISGAVAYLINKTQHSGQATTASADIIFEAAEAIRKEQREEIVSLRAEVTALKNEMVAMRAETLAMREEMIVLRKQSAKNHQEAMSFRNKPVEDTPVEDNDDH